MKDHTVVYQWLNQNGLIIYYKDIVFWNNDYLDWSYIYLVKA